MSARTRRIVLALALASALGARLVGHLALSDMAHVMDEIAYLFQAKLFAAGELRAPEALPRAAFTTWFLEDRGARYGIFPPGWPLVLALGVKLGLTAWVNPALHGITVALLGRVGQRVSGARVAIASALLYAASPQAVLLAASRMSHTLVALCAGIVLVFGTELVLDAPADADGDAREADAGARLAASPSRALTLAAGAALGLAAATRPLCGTILGAFLAIVLVYRAAARTRAGAQLAPLARAAALLAAGAVPPVLGLLAFNRALTGSLLRFPQMAYFDEHLAPADLPFFQYRKGCNALGLGPGHGCDLTVHDAQHTLGNALSNLGDNMTAWLLLACGPLLAFGVVSALVRKETRARAALLLAVPALSFALYALYWHGGTCFGARFYQSALPATLVVVALGTTNLPLFRGAVHARVRQRAAVALLASAMAWNAFAYVRTWKEIADPVWGYWAVDDRYERLAASWKNGPAVVMVAFGPDDLYNPRLGWTAIVPDGAMWMLNIRALAALAQNPADLGQAGDVVFAKFHPALVGELRARFPGRSLWLYVDHGRREKDHVAPYDPAPFASRANDLPPDNFDGFRVSAPTLPQPGSLAPPRPYWP
jgi:hypothetical protein